MEDKIHEITSTVDRINTLVSQLTLEEQVALLAGADFLRTVPIPGLNIPALKVMGGGTTQMNVHRRVSPLDGLCKALGEANVTHAGN